MAIEDYTTYTEEDPNTDITVIAGKITVDTIRRDADAWVVKDFGAGFFSGPFEHNFDLKVTAFNAQAIAGFHMLGSIVGTEKNHVAASGDAVLVQASDWGAAAPGVRLLETTGGAESNSGDAVVVDVGTQYYCTLTSSATNAYVVTVYSDASRTTVVGTDSLTGTSGLVFRYAYGMVNPEATGDATSSYEVSNLEFIPVSSGARKTHWGPWYWLAGPGKSFGQILPK